MGTHITNVNPRADAKDLPDLGVIVEFAESIEIEKEEVAKSLLAQEGEWARPNSNEAKAARDLRDKLEKAAASTQAEVTETETEVETVETTEGEAE